MSMTNGWVDTICRTIRDDPTTNKWDEDNTHLTPPDDATF